MIRLTTLGETVANRLVHGCIEVTTGDRGFTDVTEALCEFVVSNRLSDGLVCAFVAHTTASLTVQENADPSVQADLVDALDRLAPADQPYRHAIEGPDDMPGHIKAMLTAASVTFGVARGRVRLGTWQALYLVEHRVAGRRRSIDLTYVGV